MKILFTLNSSNFGGLEKTVLDLASGLSARGHQVYILCPSGDYLEEYKKHAKVFTTKRISKIDFRYIGYLKKILIKEKIDVLHANDPRIIINSLIAGFLAKTPVKITHTHTPISFWPISNFSKKVNIFLNSSMVNLFSDYEICLSESVKKQKLSEGILNRKLFIISNCLDLEFSQIASKARIFKIRSRSKNFNFLNISRFTEEKNHLLLIEAFSHVYKLNKSARLTIIGKGLLYGEAKKLISKLSLDGVVDIIPEVTQEEKIEYLRHCHSFVFPTQAEGFGLVLIEAMCFTFPVISSDLDVLKEVSGNRVVFFKNNDLNDLVEKMLYAIDIDYDPLKILKNRDFIINKYSFEKYVKSYEKLYLSKL
jgi:glycosyltransferase involved in cell wall biosynthesis